MRVCKYSPHFKKTIKKLNGQELVNVYDKMLEITSCKNINHYKNLKSELKKYKRVHVNKSFVILFFGDDGSDLFEPQQSQIVDGTVYFVNYKHHDEVYKDSKNNLKKYESIIFEEQL